MWNGEVRGHVSQQGVDCKESTKVTSGKTMTVSIRAVSDTVVKHNGTEVWEMLRAGYTPHNWW